MPQLALLSCQCSPTLLMSSAFSLEQLYAQSLGAPAVGPAVHEPNAWDINENDLVVALSLIPARIEYTHSLIVDAGGGCARSGCA